MEALRDDINDLCRCEEAAKLLKDRGLIDYLTQQVIKRKIKSELQHVLEAQIPKFEFGKTEKKQDNQVISSV